ncbi:MAG: hypothetical protein M0T74_00865 [Desulfitobacterium hafniense]|nr:hypothetical protein [Desulfitobacterium hafniense]
MLPKRTNVLYDLGGEELDLFTKSDSSRSSNRQSAEICGLEILGKN